MSLYSFSFVTRFFVVVIIVDTIVHNLLNLLIFIEAILCAYVLLLLTLVVLFMSLLTIVYEVSFVFILLNIVNAVVLLFLGLNILLTILLHSLITFLVLLLNLLRHPTVLEHVVSWHELVV